MTMETYITTRIKTISTDIVPGDKYVVETPTITEDEEFYLAKAMDLFPIFEKKDNIFSEIPEYVWTNSQARLFLQQLSFVYLMKKNPIYSYTPIRVEQEEGFFVLEWLFRDKRFSFYFSDNEDNKYSVLIYNSNDNTFINSIKNLSSERYKEIAEEVISYVS